MLTSLQNPKVKAVAKLRERQHRERLGLTIVEGRQEIACALASRVNLTELYFCEAILQSDKDLKLIDAAKSHGTQVVSVSLSVFKKIAYGNRAEGLLGLAVYPRRSLNDLQGSSCPLLLVVEGIEKPGNLGALMRSADAAGVTGVIGCEARTDLFNPNAIRASLGTIFAMPVAEARSIEALKWLQEHRIQAIAASPAAERLYSDVDYRKPSAIVLGSEHEGLSKAWMEASDERVRIPMLGRADSLNLAMSGAILAFEAARQRRQETSEQ